MLARKLREVFVLCAKFTSEWDYSAPYPSDRNGGGSTLLKLAECVTCTCRLPSPSFILKVCIQLDRLLSLWQHWWRGVSSFFVLGAWCETMPLLMLGWLCFFSVNVKRVAVLAISRGMDIWFVLLMIDSPFYLHQDTVNFCSKTLIMFWNFMRSS